MASRPAPPAAAKPKLAVTGKPVGTSKPGDAGASKSGLSPAAERMKFCADVLAGYKVEVQVADGVVYEGVVDVMNCGGEQPSITLRYAKTIKDTSSDKNAMAERPIDEKVFALRDVVQILAREVRMAAEDVGPADSFETDAAIGRGRGGLVDRELQRWTPDASDPAAHVSLEEASYGPGGWDQFRVNEEKFGVVSTFDETLYTTRLDKSRANISEAEAERLAREIESGMMEQYNPHLAEERGLAVDDSGLDEEDKYSSVIRHPAQQQQQQQQQQQRRGPPPPPPTRAWGSAGSGIAAVTANWRSQAPGQPIPARPPPPPPAAGSDGAPSTASTSPPAAVLGADGSGMDPRKEVNKMRMQMNSIPGKKSSPYGTPKGGQAAGGRSPLVSPLVGDAQLIDSLDLHPGVSKGVDEGVRRQFVEFKKQQQAAGPGAKTREEEISSLRAAAQWAPPRSGPASGAGAAGAAVAAAPAASTSATAAAKDAGAADAAKPADDKAADKPKSKLNPNAKTFESKLSASAKVFVPGAGLAAAAAASAPAIPVVSPVIPAPPPIPGGHFSGPGGFVQHPMGHMAGVGIGVMKQEGGPPPPRGGGAPGGPMSAANMPGPLMTPGSEMGPAGMHPAGMAMAVAPGGWIQPAGAMPGAPYLAAGPQMMAGPGGAMPFPPAAGPQQMMQAAAFMGGPPRPMAGAPGPAGYGLLPAGPGGVQPGQAAMFPPGTPYIMAPAGVAVPPGVSSPGGRPGAFYPQAGAAYPVGPGGMPMMAPMGPGGMGGPQQGGHDGRHDKPMGPRGGGGGRGGRGGGGRGGGGSSEYQQQQQQQQGHAHDHSQ